jgi:hypothetical protein
VNVAPELFAAKQIDPSDRCCCSRPTPLHKSRPGRLKGASSRPAAVDHAMLQFVSQAARRSPKKGNVDRICHGLPSHLRLLRARPLANGPRYRTPRPDLTSVDTTAANYLQESTVPLANERTAVKMFRCTRSARAPVAWPGVMEQNAIFDVMLKALERQ